MNYAIQGLLHTNRILEVDFVPLVINPISVARQNTGKERLTLDLRYVEKRIYKDKIKFDNLKLMSQLVNVNKFKSKFA